MYIPYEGGLHVSWWVVRVTLSYWAEALDVIAFFDSYFLTLCVCENVVIDDQSRDQFRTLVSSSMGIPFQAFRGYGAEGGHA